jgi:hypothetical protein
VTAADAVESRHAPVGGARPIRVLRVSNSQDTFGTFDDEVRPYRVAARMLEEAEGRPVETIVHVAWPTENLPEVIDRWLDRYEPDMLYLKVIDYWFAFESVPVRMERMLGRLGRPVARTGKKAASQRWLAFNPFFRGLRFAAQATIGGEPMFEPEQVVERISATVRRATRREDLVIVVDGPLGVFRMSPRKKKQRWAEERRLRIHRAMEDLCQQLHIVHRGMERPRYLAASDPVLGDGLHFQAEGQVRLGQEEGVAMVEAWLRAHPAGPARKLELAGG